MNSVDTTTKVQRILISSSFAFNGQTNHAEDHKVPVNQKHNELCLGNDCGDLTKAKVDNQINVPSNAHDYMSIGLSSVCDNQIKCKTENVNARLNDSNETPAHKKRKVHERVKLHSPSFAKSKEKGVDSQRAKYTLAFKLDAIAYMEESDPKGKGPGNTIGKTYAARRLGITPKMLREWKKSQGELEAAANKDRFHLSCKELNSDNSRLRQVNAATYETPKPKFSDIEVELVSWMKGQTNLTPKMIKEQVSKLDPVLFGEKPLKSESDAYKQWQDGAARWYVRFLRKKNRIEGKNNGLKQNEVESSSLVPNEKNDHKLGNPDTRPGLKVEEV